MNLTELPALIVERVEQNAEQTLVHGRFDRLDGVREHGCFRLKRGEYAWSDLTIVDRASGEVTANVTYWGDLRMGVGGRYIWLDTYWQVPFVEALADETTEWCRFTFQPTDAQYYRKGNAVGWQQVGGRLPDGAVPLEVKPGGWDHEHCELCGDQINVENPIGYVDEEKNFLCSACYDRYGASHDVSFQVGA